MRLTTLAEKLDSASGRPAGFDYMRMLLALAILSWHTIVTTYGQAFQDSIWANTYWFSILGWLLPAFFALSGFLVAGSLERCKTIAGFLYLRIIRIFPALVVEVVVSAFVLGPLMTSLPLGAYFRDPRLFSYFLNCIGHIHYFLPGVFLHNPHKGFVNSQLWTIPFELKCYIILGLLGVVGFARNRWLLLAAVLAYFGMHAVHYVRHPDPTLLDDQGFKLVMAFLFGVILYNFRREVPYSAIIAAVAFVVAVVLSLVPSGWVFAPLPMAYVVTFLGLTNPRKIALLDSGDYSYGIYLYSFPIQQTVVATGLVPNNGWINLAVSAPIVVVLAVCSWHLWEKRWLEMRRFRPSIDNLFRLTRPGMIVGHIYRLAMPEKV